MVTGSVAGSWGLDKVQHSAWVFEPQVAQVQVCTAASCLRWQVKRLGPSAWFEYGSAAGKSRSAGKVAAGVARSGPRLSRANGGP